ncbi:trimeric autotransporter adhesin [Paraburkholderia sp. BL6665CI2N2]|nr:trimeric autotransporter adhesin [Paraburkholderia sp. BL6665CI2N2]
MRSNVWSHITSLAHLPAKFQCGLACADRNRTSITSTVDRISTSGSNGTVADPTGTDSVVLGANSVADRDNTVSVGAPGAARQITNVADGTAPTDAVDVRQMNSAINSIRDDMQKYRRDANAGSAPAVALSMLPQAPAPGKSVIGAAVGNYAGQTGFAVGVTESTSAVAGRHGRNRSVRRNGPNGVYFFTSCLAFFCVLLAENRRKKIKKKLRIS